VRIEILDPGALTSVQDALGRPSWRHLGVPAGGAADAWSARLANRLVGNPDEAPVLEITLIGPTIRLEKETVVALVGRFDATVDNVPLPPDSARPARPGSILRIATGTDARGYLAFAGGVAVEGVLGSAATDLRTGFGGFEGRALRTGDRLRLGAASQPRPMRWTGQATSGPVRILPGPHARLIADALVGPIWRVSALADRTGARLDGPKLSPAVGLDVPSMGLPAGAIQVPPDGRPIVMLADRPVTGGYPVPAVVIGADVGRVARLRTGDELRFASVTPDEALDAWRQAEQDLSALVPLGAADDDLGWTGSHA
jgi:biotin-dependent carboxylase-like uncharacterized protein